MKEGRRRGHQSDTCGRDSACWAGALKWRKDPEGMQAPLEAGESEDVAFRLSLQQDIALRHFDVSPGSPV